MNCQDMPISTDSQMNIKPLVLVVDDEQIIRRLMHACLEEQGYKVCSVSSAQEALTRISATDQPLIVVTDWNMPGMSGVELCRAIRNGDQGRYVYLLMVTSREAQKDIVEAIGEGGEHPWVCGYETGNVEGADAHTVFVARVDVAL